jgi:hypothetical protein
VVPPVACERLIDRSEPSRKLHPSPIELQPQSVDEFVMRDDGAMPEPAPSTEGSNPVVDSDARALVAAWLPFLTQAGLKGRIYRGRLLLGDSPLMVISGSRLIYRTAAGRQEVHATRDAVDATLRRIVLTRGRRALERSATEALRAYSALRIEHDREGVRVLMGDAEVALVRPDDAVVLEAAETIPGNFLVAGQHWKALCRACEKRAVSIFRDERASRSPRRCHRVLPARTAVRVVAAPERLAEELIDDCLAASLAIREHRTTVLGHRARVRGQSCTIVLDPIRLVGNRLAVPFIYYERGLRGQGDESPIDGILTIEGDEDPLPVTLGECPLSDRGRHAWAASLLAFRAISVSERAKATSYPMNGHRARRRHSQSHGRRQQSRDNSVAWTVDPDYWSSSIMLDRSPSGPHWVVGHRRLLPVGQQASPDKIAEAASYGIRLAPGETWVSPHARGAPADAVMPFYWDCPDSLQRAIARLGKVA